MLLVGVLGQVGLFGSIQTNSLMARSAEERRWRSISNRRIKRRSRGFPKRFHLRGVHQRGERFVRESLLVSGDAENVITTIWVSSDSETVRVVSGHHDQRFVFV